MGTNIKIINYSLDQDEICGLSNFDYEENYLSCCDIYKAYLELYKQMVANKVSTYYKKCTRISLKIMKVLNYQYEFINSLNKKYYMFGS